jgi:N-acetyl-anhydromuramyl-L-alanine amidase AmpD
MDPKNWIGDKGYIGNNMITPYRKPAGGELLDWQKEYNTQVNKIRWMIEQVISHLKTGPSCTPTTGARLAHLRRLSQQ